MTNKTAREAFYSDNDGTSFLENFVVIFSVSSTYCFRNLFLIFFKRQPSYYVTFLVDFSLLVVPITLLLTVLDSLIYPIVATQCVVLLTYIGFLVMKTTAFSVKELAATLQTVKVDTTLGYLPHVTFCRFHVTLISCICILAVDYKSFPRRFAKTEEFGMGLMDTGVAYFVFINALTSPEARGKTNIARSMKSKLLLIMHSVYSSWPLLALGFARLLSLKSIDYNEHVSEYGVHWNFFFTLSIVKILSSILLLILSVKKACVLSAIVVAIYQYFLANSELSSVIFNMNRDGFIMANKEGIVSCVGYLMVYLPCVLFGQYLAQPKRPTLYEWTKVAGVFFAIAVVSFGGLQLSVVFVQPVSRRLANVSFILWMFTLITAGICIMLTVQIIFTALIAKKKIPFHTMPDTWLPQDNHKDFVNNRCLSNAVNRNQLFYFLLSNVMTGAVNLSIDTLNSTALESVVILLTYSFVSLSVLWYLHLHKIRMKCW